MPWVTLEAPFTSQASEPSCFDRTGFVRYSPASAIQEELEKALPTKTHH